MLGVDLVEPVPDCPMIVKIEPSGECDLGSRGQKHLVFGPSLGSKEVAAVNHGRGQCAMITIDPERGRQAEPAWNANCSAAWSRKNSHAVAALDHHLTFGGEAFEFDRADLRAVLFLLAMLLRLLVVVEFSFDPACGAVEEVDGRPEQVVEVGFEARVTERRD